MIATWTFTHPDVVPHLHQPWVADVAQVYTLVFVLLSQGVNYFVITPMLAK